MGNRNKSGKGDGALKTYRIHQIKLRIGEKTDVIPSIIRSRSGKRELEIYDWKIVRRSVDARDKGDIRLVYSVDFTCSSEHIDLPEAPDLEYRYVMPRGGEMPSGTKRPVIVGFGPCGMFCALILSQMGFRPIVLERGKKVSERSRDVDAFRQSGVLDTESNVQFGEGGAGTFSDGKLTTGIKDPRVRKVIEEFAAAGAGDDILVDARPHIGTDVLKTAVANIREAIIKNGGEVLFSTKAENITSKNGILSGVDISGQGHIDTDDLVLAVGHSARDTFSMLAANGFTIEQKPFSIGVRIEHEQSLINKAQYGSDDRAKILGPADYKLSYHGRNGRGVYTFCMCPGGEVIIASSEEGGVVTNGMSDSARSGKYANSGLLADVRTEDLGSSDPLAGVEFQRKYERLAFEYGGRDYKAPRTELKDFRGSDVEKCLPDFASEAITEAVPFMARRLRGFDDPHALMTGVETRSSSPVRIIRDENMMADIAGVYPCGEGAGYAGGIVSAAVDGIKAAERIALRYRK